MSEKPTTPRLGQRMRSTNDGQVGFYTEAEGKPVVRLDRAQQAILLPYSQSRWVPDEQGRLTPIHVARVAYEADRALRSARGAYGIKDWMQLLEPERMGWINGPPKPDAEQTALYAAIRKALG